MVVPLPSKQIAPGQYRYTPPSPLYGLGPITRLPSCGGQNISAVNEGHSRCLFIRDCGVKFNEFMFRFRGWQQGPGPAKRMGIVPRPESA